MEALFTIFIALIALLRKVDNNLANAFEVVRDRMWSTIQTLTKDLEYCKDRAEALDKALCERVKNVKELKQRIGELELSEKCSDMVPLRSLLVCWYVEVPIEWMAQNRISAVHALREVTGLGQRESMDVVEERVTHSKQLFDFPLTASQMLIASYHLTECPGYNRCCDIKITKQVLPLAEEQAKTE